jgi:2-phosphosulfolactate phosphatase
MNGLQVEVCFSPALFPHYFCEEAHVVVIDVLRATTSMCVAFMNGAQSIIPVGTVEALRHYVGTGCLIAAERNGFPLDFADFGNSPDEFTAERVRGREVAYSTTNGTRTIQMASRCHEVYIGAYTNFSAVCRRLVADGRPVILLCSGWKDRFNLEDSVLAGVMAERLLDSGFTSQCDSVVAAMALWSAARPDLLGFARNYAHLHRLAGLGIDRIVPFCHTFDLTDLVPRFDGKALVAVRS